MNFGRKRDLGTAPGWGAGLSFRGHRDGGVT